MIDAGRGLKDLSTDTLKTLLRLVHTGKLPCPFQKKYADVHGSE